MQMRRKRICAQKTARFGCDIMMPVMDGYAATGAIRTMDRPDAKEVQIVAMTANAFAEDMKKCRDAGMNAHLAKPFKVEQLISSIADRG